MNNARKALTILEGIRVDLMAKLADVNMKIAACELVLAIDMPDDGRRRVTAERRKTT